MLNKDQNQLEYYQQFKKNDLPKFGNFHYEVIIPFTLTELKGEEPTINIEIPGVDKIVLNDWSKVYDKLVDLSVLRWIWDHTSTRRFLSSTEIVDRRGRVIENYPVDFVIMKQGDYYLIEPRLGNAVLNRKFSKSTFRANLLDSDSMTFFTDMIIDMGYIDPEVIDELRAVSKVVPVSQTAVATPLPNINTFVRNVFSKLEGTNFKLHIDVAGEYVMSLMFETLNIDLGESLLEKDSRTLDVNLAMFDCGGLSFSDVDFNEFVKAALDNELSINVGRLAYLDVGLVQEIVIYTGDDPKDASQSIFIERLYK